MKIKRLAYLVTAAMLSCFLVFGNLAFANSTAAVGIMSDSSAIQTGSQFNVTVTGQSIRDMDAYEADITFDKDKLDFVSAVSDVQHGVTELKTNGNKITLAFAKYKDAPAENGNLSLCTFTFKGKAEGTAAICLDIVKILDGILAETDYTTGNQVSVVIGSGQPPANVQVSSIEVTGNGGIDEIITKGGSLQMVAEVCPANAKNKSVAWSVENGTGKAAISSSGLLTAESDGTVTVKATALDGSGVIGTCQVTISGQSSGGGTGTSGSSAGSGTAGVNSGTIEEKATIDSSGTAEVIVTADAIQQAIDSAAGNEIIIRALNITGAKKVEINIPAQQIRAAINKNIKRITFDTGLATVSISTDILGSKITDSSSNIKLTVEKIDPSTLPENIRLLAGDNPVYDFGLSADGTNIGEFNGRNDVGVSFNYTLKPGEDPGKVVVYYIDGSGNLQTVTNGRYDPAAGRVEFSPQHFSKYAAAYNDVTFSDIGGASWAKASIEALAARGIISGTGNNLFKPGDNVTRAEFANMLMLAFGLNDETATCSFSDVSKGAWYYSPVASAKKLGIASGKGDGSFGVNNKITRQDMAVMIYRTAKLLGVRLDGSNPVTQFTDAHDISAYAVDSVTAIKKAGIISGTGNGAFDPKGYTTRAQAAVIIYRLFIIAK